MQTAIRVLRTAVNALRRNVMRSILTCLGIIIGVGAVIAMMEIGQGSQGLIESTIARMGADNIIVFPGTASNTGVSQGIGSVVTLHPQDADAILRECTAIRSVAPLVKTRVQLVYGNKNWTPQNMNGTTPDYIIAHDWPIEDGDMFSDRDVRNGSKVCVVGQTLVRELFDGESPVGKELRLNNVSFRVVGVLVAKGAGMGGWDQDDTLLAPWTTIKFRVSNQGSSSSSSSSSSTSQSVNTLNQLYPNQGLQLYPQESVTQQADTPKPVRFSNIDQILVAANGSDQVPVAMRQIRAVLRERHRLQPGQPDDFVVRDMTEWIQAMAQMTSTMSTLLLAVALISLVVGGVGIMNIMLVSVTERTREIGLRMAVGARARDILRQFLVEATVLCLLGGATGILLGRGASMAVRKFLQWPTAISIPAIVSAVAVSASVGIIFGYYPAWKASRLDPIEALRYE